MKVLYYIKRGVVLFFGSVLILLGVALLVLPGPGWLTIFLGLLILATEYGWARNVLSYLKSLKNKVLGKRR